MKTKLTHDEIRARLYVSGWREYKSLGDEIEIWCKRYPDAPSCACNSDRTGVQVTVTVHEFSGTKSYAIDVTAEKPDGGWVRLQRYGIGGELMDVLDHEAQGLVAAWALMHCYSAAGREVKP